ncbi:RES family NAD+ phosphorylase [Pacificimonas flava]|uniref:RES family NAD+ phosphorylase n=1 Tax=Pacificimonas flava TaxID=1234595 RepID=UPI00098FEE5A|nr:RES family NAD+ phosphorylase [Pacificimonas flava]
MTLPPRRRLRQNDTHRLVPSKYSEGGESILTRISDNTEHLQGIFDLDHATNDRLFAENNLLPGIGIDELVFGISYYRIVNAAFTHAHPLGSRFNGPDRGAWYAGFDLATSQAEIAFHRSVELAEIDWAEESVTYDDYLADFGGEFHDITAAPEFAHCLDKESYVASQDVAEVLLKAGSAGLVYPSVRSERGVCLVCFRPALVNNVRKQARYRFTWSGNPAPEISLEQTF